MINLCLSLKGFFFCVFYVYRHFCFCFFSCILCRHLCLVCLCWILLVFLLKKLKKIFTFFTVLGKMTFFATVEASLGSVTKVSSGTSVVSVAIISISSTSVSVSISVTTSAVEISWPFASWSFDLDLLSVDGFSVHTKLSYVKSKREIAETRVNTISTECKYIVRVNSLFSILGVFVLNESKGEGVLLPETNIFNGSEFFKLFSKIIFGKLNQQHLLRRHLS